ncbi:unnamed protein product [Mycena citricolor]|uniref:Uncharacterized protein n=1 Tax=Mycena citricolor TaxID=2018698 RepID=A0AAD2JZ97_9AGAR|nr:unnamed protein product [Mycena citricolor]
MGGSSGSSIISSIVPRAPFVRSKSVSILLVTISSMPTASSMVSSAWHTYSCVRFLAHIRRVASSFHGIRTPCRGVTCVAANHPSSNFSLGFNTKKIQPHRVRHTHLLFQYHDGREFFIHDTTDFRVHSVVHLASSAEPPVVRCRLQCTTCRIIQRLIDRFGDRRELVKVAAKNHVDPTERFVRARRFPNPDVSRKNGEKIFTEHRYFVND